MYALDGVRQVARGPQDSLGQAGQPSKYYCYEDCVYPSYLHEALGAQTDSHWQILNLKWVKKNDDDATGAVVPYQSQGTSRVSWHHVPTEAAQACSAQYPKSPTGGAQSICNTNTFVL